VTPEEAPERACSNGHVLFGQDRLDLGQGHVGSGFDQREDRPGVSLDPGGPPIAAQRPGARLASLPRQPPPAADARRAQPETLTGLPVRCAGLDRRDDPNPQIQRQRFRHARRPPIPADSLMMWTPPPPAALRC